MCVHNWIKQAVSMRYVIQSDEESSKHKLPLYKSTSPIPAFPVVPADW